MRRPALVLTGLGVALLAGWIVGVAFGTANLEASTLLKALFTDSGDPTAEVIVRSLRIPRVVAALVVGACLGAAGSLIQSATRNPLGDPQLFGLGGGAAIVQALTLVGVLGTGAWGLTSLSVVAALIGALLIFVLSSRESVYCGSSRPDRCIHRGFDSGSCRCHLDSRTDLQPASLGSVQRQPGQPKLG